MHIGVRIPHHHHREYVVDLKSAKKKCKHAAYAKLKKLAAPGNNDVEQWSSAPAIVSQENFLAPQHFATLIKDTVPSHQT